MDNRWPLKDCDEFGLRGTRTSNVLPDMSMQAMSVEVDTAQLDSSPQKRSTGKEAAKTALGGVREHTAAEVLFCKNFGRSLLGGESYLCGAAVLVLRE